jgi:hypothetical protein
MVYLVKYGIKNEGLNLIGVHDTFEKAEAQARDTTLYTFNIVKVEQWDAATNQRTEILLHLENDPTEG